MANGIKIGDNNVTFKVGSADCKVYLGDTLLYPHSPTPPVFEGKWLATYTGGTTSSAECGSSSAITQNEITKENLVSVEIGDCVTRIGIDAFSDCSGLTSIDIPDSVTTISSYAFSGCRSLTSVTIPSSVTTIGDDAFEGCSNLRQIDIPSGVTSIGSSVFQDCSSLSSATISDSVTSIGQNAFYYCSRLTSCTIGSGVRSIGNSTFWNCRSLTSITCNATTPPTLGNNAFLNTNNCPIYVPSASVSAYKAASGWSDYASRITAIP